MKTSSQIPIIVFTYKRAMQLDLFLTSVFKNFKNLDLPIHIIYHYYSKHDASYKLLQKKWGNKVKFYKRKDLNIFSIKFKFFFRIINYLWILRWPIIITKFNNFKFLLEDILNNLKSDFVILSTDDQVYFKKTYVSNKILNEINQDPSKRIYRFYTGDHFSYGDEIPKKMNVKYYKDYHNTFFSWRFDDCNANILWKYRFTVDSTIYHRKSLLRFLNPFVYHNPITLEAIGLWESRFRNFFLKGYSSKHRSAAGYQLNNVQKLVDTPSSNFDPDFLAKIYLKGFNLSVKDNEFNRKIFNINPMSLFFKKKNKRYSLNFLKKHI
jgi:hypothetical protein